MRHVGLREILTWGITCSREINICVGDGKLNCGFFILGANRSSARTSQHTNTISHSSFLAELLLGKLGPDCRVGGVRTCRYKKLSGIRPAAS